MKTGRPPNTSRTSFGQQLHMLREQAGLSQQQLADRIGLTQRAYAYWERHPVALRPDQLPKVAEALNVSVEDLWALTVRKNEELVQPAGCVSYSKLLHAFPAANNRRSAPSLKPSLPNTPTADHQ